MGPDNNLVKKFLQRKHYNYVQRRKENYSIIELINKKKLTENFKKEPHGNSRDKSYNNSNENFTS